MSVNDLWIEKYRPQTLNEMCLNEEIKEKILSWNKSIPHLLLVGRPGIGKTSLARILVLNILDCDYLYINASDENGVETMRTKVSGFVQTKSLNGNIKVVILDEADSISLNGQDILRNMMESYADNARFILTGNYRHKIGEALQSRCQTLELQYDIRSVVKRCMQILVNENCLPKSKETQQLIINTIIKKNFPDIRKCISNMQKCYINGQFKLNENRNNNEIIEIIWNNVLQKKGVDTRKYLLNNEELFNSDWNQLLIELLNYIYELNMDDVQKKQSIILIADHLEKATRVIDKEINLFACLLNLEEIS